MCHVQRQGDAPFLLPCLPPHLPPPHRLPLHIRSDQAQYLELPHVFRRHLCAGAPALPARRSNAAGSGGSSSSSSSSSNSRGSSSSSSWGWGCSTEARQQCLPAEHQAGGGLGGEQRAEVEGFGWHKPEKREGRVHGLTEGCLDRASTVIITGTVIIIIIIITIKKCAGKKQRVCMDLVMRSAWI